MIVVQVTSVKAICAMHKLSFVCLRNSTRDGGGVFSAAVPFCATQQASSMQLLVVRHPTGVMRALCPRSIQVSDILGVSVGTSLTGTFDIRTDTSILKLILDL